MQSRGNVQPRIQSTSSTVTLVGYSFIPTRTIPPPLGSEQVWPSTPAPSRPESCLFIVGLFLLLSFCLRSVPVPLNRLPPRIHYSRSGSAPSHGDSDGCRPWRLLHSRRTSCLRISLFMHPSYHRKFIPPGIILIHPDTPKHQLVLLL